MFNFDDVLVNFNTVLLDGYDNAIVGLTTDGEHVIYSEVKIIKLLMENEMDYSTASEFFDYNILPLCYNPNAENNQYKPILITERSEFDRS